MVVRYTVKGNWPFPLDMLRYDGSAAATPEDQAVIDRLCEPSAPDRAAIADKVEVNLVIDDGDRRRPSTSTARWESFGWMIPGDLEHQMVEDERKKRLRMEALRDSAMAKLTDEEREALAWFNPPHR